MKNHKIVFANQKGGVGKSTLCMLFANYLAWKKQDVCLIDTDLQKTIMMQRKKDREIYEDMEEPYTVQDLDVQLRVSCSLTRPVMYRKTDWCPCLQAPTSLSAPTNMRKRHSTRRERSYRLSMP